MKKSTKSKIQKILSDQENAEKSMPKPKTEKIRHFKAIGRIAKNATTAKIKGSKVSVVVVVSVPSINITFPRFFLFVVEAAFFWLGAINVRLKKSVILRILKKFRK